MVSTVQSILLNIRVTDSGDTVPGSVWYYQPNKIVPPIFAAAFLASGTVHAWQS